MRSWALYPAWCAALRALGAIGVDVAYGFAIPYLPATVASPVATDGSVNYLYYAVKGAAALGLGLIAKKAIGASKAGHIINGSLTVTMHDAMKQFIAGNMGGAVTLGNFNSGLPVRGKIPGMGAYISGANLGGVGRYLPNASPAQSGMNVISGNSMAARETAGRY